MVSRRWVFAIVVGIGIAAVGLYIAGLFLPYDTTGGAKEDNYPW